MSALSAQVAEIVRSRGLRRFDEPVTLASGEQSREFVDVKAALARGEDLEVACRAMLEALAARDVDFDAVGGLTMGADAFAHVMAVLARRTWFVVRKEPKDRGTRRLVEGGALAPGTRVVLVEDTVTTGGSVARAYHAVRAEGATVAAAVTLVDRGDLAAGFFAAEGVPYLAVCTYRDLGIEPVRGRTPS